MLRICAFCWGWKTVWKIPSNSKNIFSEKYSNGCVLDTAHCQCRREMRGLCCPTHTARLCCNKDLTSIGHGWVHRAGKSSVGVGEQHNERTHAGVKKNCSSWLTSHVGEVLALHLTITNTSPHRSKYHSHQLKHSCKLRYSTDARGFGDDWCPTGLE